MRISSLTQTMRAQDTVTNLQARISLSQKQLSTGRKSDTFSGLQGENARSSVQLRDGVARKESYIESIQTTKLRTTVMGAALEQITTLASDFRVELIKQQDGLLGDTAPAMRTFAQEAIDRLSRLLNAEADGRKLFSGHDIGTNPIVDTDTMKTNYTTGHPSLTAGSAAILNYSATFHGTEANWFQGGSAITGQKPFLLSVDEGITLEYGELANNDAFEELFELLEIFANNDYAENSGMDTAYEELVTNAISRVDTAHDNINTMVGTLGVTRKRMEDTLEAHKEDIVILQQQIDDVENVNAFEAMSTFQILQAQLEASYQTTVSLRNLSLSRYL